MKRIASSEMTTNEQDGSIESSRAIDGPKWFQKALVAHAH